MKVLVVCAVFVISALAEPPVENRYLPPNQGYKTTNQDSFAPPSPTYGTPSFGPQKQTDALIRSRPSSNYLPPSQSRAQSRRPSQQYGAPAPSSQYNAPSPSSQYGAPAAASQYSAPSAEYGAPAKQQGFGQGFNAQQQFAPSAPSQQYGAPRQPSQQYGAPEQSRSYLPPNAGLNAGLNGGYGGDDEGNGEPANYSFEYMVKDDESGNDFGHRESRMGDRAEGVYYVLLPDGRKQTVEYEADQNGYRPKISYEDVGIAGGYDSNSQSRSGYQNGYQNGNQQNGY